MDKKFQEKLKKHLKTSLNLKGHKIISEVYSHEGYTDTKDSNFDIVRKYEKKFKT